MGLIVGLGILVNTFWGTIQQHVLSYATDMSVSGLLQETNSKRIAGGLGNLALNAQLNQAAQTKANDMAARDYWSHNTPDGSPPWIFISNAGYDYKTAGENLAYGFDSSTEAVIGWMNSPGHKANIMNTGYTEVGFGIANAASYQGTGPQTIVVAMYASPAVLAATTTTPAPPPSTPKPTPVAAKPATQPVTPAPAAQPEAAPKEEANTTPAPIKEKSQDAATSTPTVTTQKVARIQLLSGATAAWSTFAASTIAAVALVVFFLRHGLLLRRVLVKSERFIHKHPLFDIALLAIATIGIILSQTGGIIR